MAMKLSECEIAKSECEWLVHKTTKLGIIPFSKNGSHSQITTAEHTLSQFKYPMRSIRCLWNHMPEWKHLAEYLSLLRPFLCQKIDLSHVQAAFNALKDMVRVFSSPRSSMS